MNTDNQPTARPPWSFSLALGLILAAVGLAAGTAIYMAVTDRPEPSIPTDPGYVADHSNNFLNPAQAYSHLETYLALTLWAEIAYETASEAPHTFYRALTLPRPTRCARPSGRPRTNEEVVQCVRAAAAAAANSGATPWTDLTFQQRDHAAITYLSNLWRATDPTEEIRITIIWRGGLDPTDAPSVQELQRAYQHCPDRMMAQRNRLANANSNLELAQRWLAIAENTSTCADETSTQLFLPPKEGQPPPAPASPRNPKQDPIPTDIQSEP